MPDENDTSQKAKSGVLASVRASVGALSLVVNQGNARRRGSYGRIVSYESPDG